MTPLTLKQFLNDRATLANDSAAIAAALGAAKANATAQKSQAYRILIRVRFPNGRQTASEVVIGLRGEEDPYRVLSWQDDVQGDVTRRPRAQMGL
jgi:general secretion pathway protein K